MVQYQAESQPLLTVSSFVQVSSISIKLRACSSQSFVQVSPLSSVISLVSSSEPPLQLCLSAAFVQVLSTCTVYRAESPQLSASFKFLPAPARCEWNIIGASEDLTVRSWKLRLSLAQPAVRFPCSTVPSGWTSKSPARQSLLTPVQAHTSQRSTKNQGVISGVVVRCRRPRCPHIWKRSCLALQPSRQQQQEISELACYKTRAEPSTKANTSAS